MSNKRKSTKLTKEQINKKYYQYEIKQRLYDLFTYINDVTLNKSMSKYDRHAFLTVLGELEDCFLEVSCLGDEGEDDVMTNRMCQILDAQRYYLEKM